MVPDPNSEPADGDVQAAGGADGCCSRVDHGLTAHDIESDVRLVGQRREDIEFGVYLCLSERRFERVEFVEATLDILATTLPEFVVEIASKSLRRLCHCHLLE